jgi:hypothetical protein
MEGAARDGKGGVGDDGGKKDRWTSTMCNEWQRWLIHTSE